MPPNSSKRAILPAPGRKTAQGVWAANVLKSQLPGSSDSAGAQPVPSLTSLCELLLETWRGPAGTGGPPSHEVTLTGLHFLMPSPAGRSTTAHLLSLKIGICSTAGTDPWYFLLFLEASPLQSPDVSSVPGEPPLHCSPISSLTPQSVGTLKVSSTKTTGFTWLPEHCGGHCEGL